MRVFVLLFTADNENTGIHTISIGHRNVVLMFEEEDDATRYALLLEAQDFPTPIVEQIDRAEIEEFCTGADYESKLIPKGFVPQDEFDRLLLSPPEANREDTDWQPDGKEAPPPDSEMPNSELDRIRRQLEGLL
ncbi:DUF3110 domain-containing protein [Phormidesmis sp. 146-12]